MWSYLEQATRNWGIWKSLSRAWFQLTQHSFLITFTFSLFLAFEKRNKWNFPFSSYAISISPAWRSSPPPKQQQQQQQFWNTSMRLCYLLSPRFRMLLCLRGASFVVFLFTLVSGNERLILLFFFRCVDRFLNIYLNTWIVQTASCMWIWNVENSHIYMRNKNWREENQFPSLNMNLM